jgi:hypothetical protein
MTVLIGPDWWLLLARAVVASALLFLYAYDFTRVLDAWRDPNDRRHGSSFRALIKSSCLVLGMLSIFVGALNAAFFNDSPLIREGLRAFGYVLLGILLVGGLGLMMSWRRSDSYRNRG